MNRIQTLSCDKQEFDKAIPAYNAALERCGYKPTTQHASPAPAAQRSRHRNVIWFNPPFSLNVSTDIARQFLKLIDMHFPKNHKFHKLFNRNNMKVSYSCMPSMGSIISSHNARTLAVPQVVTRTCNCKNPDNCPLNGECLATSIVYKATVTAVGKPAKTYFGLSEGAFKARLYVHRNSFKYATKRHDTRLSAYMWELKDEGITGNINWEIARRSRPYNCGTRRCDLCTSEKLAILLADSNTLLNRRSEIIAYCRHRNKFKCGERMRIIIQPSQTL